MKLSAEQFREQLVDYLYGELRGEELAAFEASLQASEEQRRELRALEQTLGTVRQGLEESRAEPPPTRLRAALLAAAASEIASRTSASAQAGQHRARAADGGATQAASRSEATHADRVQAGHQRVAVQPAPSKLRTLVRGVGRHPVLYPALGVAAVFALVVLGRRVEQERYASESVDSLPASEREQLEQAFEQRPEQGEAEPPSAPAVQYAQPPPATLDDQRERAAAKEELRRRSGSGEGAPKKGRAGAASSAASRPAMAREQAASRFAEAPAEARAEIESRAGAAAPGRGAAFDDESRAEERGGLGAIGGGAVEAKAASAQRPSPAAPAARADRSTAKLAEPSSAPSTGAPAKPAARRAEAADSASPASVEELLRRARAHVAAGRFRDAGLVYRTLLERFPKDERAASWRKELARAEQASQEEP